ncbi:hypothetical protein FEM48_Zijuj02G0108400 [Ziziphus jujuba var. spinosa]|uniref:Uncharacterized protein n=1 Tax=Ziziphus jujuba var. spinosa TaxID=714518 RepID=A0A978VVB0_ZIZJJ|nr:hypothetical protein FEM48_Zijuj02G0108400 [Ziziphus jujuba var. spinosa]
MSNTVAQQISLFRSYILNRRLDAATLRFLDSILVSKDVKSSIEVRSSLREFMRSESLSVLREIAEKAVDQKLLVVEFLIRAFALIGDVESCLALKYEGLLFRELKSTSYQWLQVSYMEWLNFAEQSLDNGFHSIAGKGCEKALLCLQRNSMADPKTSEFFENLQAIEKIKRLKDCAIKSAASNSVQAQTTEYLKSKRMDGKNGPCSVSKGTQPIASTLFRNGIKKRNLRKLHEVQSM